MRRRPARGAGPKAPSRATAPERLHKVLAQHGIGSRRQVEAWITEGRVLVNGRPAVVGQAIGPRDRVDVDGREVTRLLRQQAERRTLVFHKTTGTILKRRAGDERAAVVDQLPALHGGRWVPLNSIGFGEEGLLVLSNDGRYAADVARLGREWPVEYRVRALRPRSAETWPAVPLEIQLDGQRLQFDAVEAVGEGGTNQWFRVAAARGLPRGAVVALFDAAGLKTSRVLLVRWGPLQLPRDLPRGRSRDLGDDELAALAAAIATRSDAQ
jgi:23S rRNA pseudouridine2605 synthase